MRLQMRRPILSATVAVPMALALLLASIQSAAADQHEEWELHVNSYPGPLAGSCGALWEVRGWSFPTHAEVVVGRIDGGAFRELARVEASANGFILFDLADPFPVDCAADLMFTFVARVADGSDFLAEDGAPREVRQTVEVGPVPPARMEVSDPTGTCHQVVVTGEGFPSDVTILLLMGDADPFAHNFAEFGRVVSDSDGGFRFETDYFEHVQCQPGDQIGIYSLVGDPKEDGSLPFPRISAVFEAGGLAPSDSGNAGIRGASSAPATWLPVSALVLLLLTARMLTRRVSR